MRIRLLPSSFGAGAPEPQYLTSYLINDAVAIDAGSIGFNAGPVQQAQVRHVFLTHSHIDHVASLPLFLETSFKDRAHECVHVYGNEAVLESLQQDLFNDRIWPDFIRISKGPNEFIRLHHIEAGQSVEVEGLVLTAVEVDHVVPTLGFVIEDRSTCVVIPSDTAPTEEIWEVANQRERVSAVFLECSFPESMRELADLTKHLTPDLFREELTKLRDEVTAVAVHIKAMYAAEIIEELRSRNISCLEFGTQKPVFEFE